MQKKEIGLANISSLWSLRSFFLIGFAFIFLSESAWSLRCSEFADTEVQVHRETSKWNPMSLLSTLRNRQYRRILAVFDLDLDTVSLQIHGKPDAKKGTISSIIYQIETKRKVKVFLSFNLEDGTIGSASRNRINFSKDLFEPLQGSETQPIRRIIGNLAKFLKLHKIDIEEFDQNTIFRTLLHEVKHTSVFGSTDKIEFDHRRMRFISYGIDEKGVPFSVSLKCGREEFDVLNGYGKEFSAHEVEARIVELGESKVYSRSFPRKVYHAIVAIAFIKLEESILRRALESLRTRMLGEIGFRGIYLYFDFSQNIWSSYRVGISYELPEGVSLNRDEVLDLFKRLIEARLVALERFKKKLDIFFQIPEVASYVGKVESDLRDKWLEKYYLEKEQAKLKK
ncbi:MAG: hypothetical protein WCH11_06060 [Bdellovibrio sp.]